MSILLHTKDRKKMIIIGSIFIFFSGFIYFLLMAAIIEVLDVIGQQIIITMLAGSVALIFGFINIKDFFFFKKGPSASIPDSQKPKLYKQMRNLVKITSIPSLIVATVILAISVNTVELACSFSYPFIYGSILTSTYALSGFEQYLYIFLYNLIYVIPLIIIVLIMVLTLGRWKLSELQGRLLKLFPGIMIFSLGEVLILNPGLVSNIFIAISILLASIALTFIIYIVTKIFENNKEIISESV
jgi:hypothetical protein